MKTKFNLFIAAMLLLLPVVSFSQIKDKQQNKETSAGTSFPVSVGEASPPVGGSSLTTGDALLTGTEGNLYFGESWPEGIISLRDGSLITGRGFRYDIYADQMQMTDGLDTLALAKPEEIHSLTFDGHTFVYQPFECSGLVKHGFFEVLVAGKTELLLKRSVTFHMKGDNENNADKYYISDCYFLKKGDNPAIKVMCNRKSAMEALCEHRDEIEAYMKSTGRKVKTPGDLKALVEYYNSLE